MKVRPNSRGRRSGGRYRAWTERRRRGIGNDGADFADFEDGEATLQLAIALQPEKTIDAGKAGRSGQLASEKRCPAGLLESETTRLTAS